MKLIIDISKRDYDFLKRGHVTFSAVPGIQNAIPLKEWLDSFNTDSAAVCFNVIQELKKEVGAE